MIKAGLLGSVAAAAPTTSGGGGGTNPNASDAHRYWRLKGTVSGTFNGGALSEIEFYSTTGEDNIATGGTPSAGSEAFGGLAIYAFDGADETVNGTMWAGASGAIAAGTSWVAYDFGSPVQIDSFKIWPRSSVNSNQMWDEWDLEWSDDGVSWTLWESFADATGWTGGAAKEFEVTAGLPPVTIFHEHTRNSTLGSSATFDVTQTVDPELGIVIASINAGNAGTISGLEYDGVVGHEIAKIKRGSFDNMAFYAFRGISGTGVKSMTFTESGSDYRAAINVWTVLGCGDDVESLSAVFNLASSEAAFTVTPEYGGAVIGAAGWRDLSSATVITTTLDNDPADYPITENDSTFFSWASSQSGFDGLTDASLAVNIANNTDTARIMAGMVALNRGFLSVDIVVDRATSYTLVGAKDEVAVKRVVNYTLVGAKNEIAVKRATTYSIVEE